MSRMRKCPACSKSCLRLSNVAKEVIFLEGMQCPNCKVVVKVSGRKGFMSFIVRVATQALVWSGVLFAFYYSAWQLLALLIACSLALELGARCLGNLEIGGLRGSLKNFNS